MEENIIRKIIENDAEQKNYVKQFTFKRYNYDRIKSISKEYFIGITGIRGIGKTTMLLQLANETENSIYISADAAYLKNYGLYEILEDLGKRNFTNIFIDEIHTKPDWDVALKTIYDEHKIRIIFSGSSAIELKTTTADLSRRAIIIHTNPLSFREYLNFKKNANISVLFLEEVLKNKRELSLKYASFSQYYEEYLRYGSVLYGQNGFKEAIENAIQKTITSDMAYLRQIDIKYEHEAYKILYTIAISKPYEVNYSSTANKLGISKTLAIRIMEDLKKTGMINLLYPCRGKNKNVKNEPKAVLSIPLRKHFTDNPEIGSLREDFFVAHTNPQCYLKTDRGEKTADFMVNGKIIEVGGVSKKNVQGADYIASEGLNFEGNKIPLFLFGFLY